MEQPGLAISGSTKWVRRRRWARVMRRRLDRPALPFADLDGAEAIRTSGDGAASHFSSNENGPASPSSSDNSNLPRTEADYVARARYTAGVGHRLGSRADPTHSDDISFRSGGAFSTVSQHHADALSSKVEARRLILRLEVCLPF